MIISEYKTLSIPQKEAVVHLWNKEYPKALALGSMAEFEKYLQGLLNRKHYIIEDEDGGVQGWLLTFKRDGEHCFAMVLDNSVQGKGLGSRLLSQAKSRHSELNGWVVDTETEHKTNGEVYLSPLGFYEKNGFHLVANSGLLKKGVHGIKVRWCRDAND